jgi:LacI family transcriptional regulator
MAQDSEPEAVTIHTVARRAGVSTATVSRVLKGTAPASESTRQKVFAAARELSYSPPARSRPSAATRRDAYGIVLEDLDSSYFCELVMGFESAAADRGQGVALFVARRRHDASDALHALARRVDGLAIGANTVPDSVVQDLSRDLPVVLLARQDVAGTDSVRAANLPNAALLTAHLLGHGRSHLVFVGDPDSSRDVAERYSGFRTAHIVADVPLRRPPLRVPLVEGAGIQVADEILRRRVKVDGLVCANDDVALAVVKRLKDNGAHLPDDLAVVGWDDVLAARYITPALTTVRAPIRDLGRLAAERLAARVGGVDPLGQAHVLPSQMVVRSSCGCPVLSPSVDL